MLYLYFRVCETVSMVETLKQVQVPREKVCHVRGSAPDSGSRRSDPGEAAPCLLCGQASPLPWATGGQGPGPRTEALDPYPRRPGSGSSCTFTARAWNRGPREPTPVCREPPDQVSVLLNIYIYVFY